MSSNVVSLVVPIWLLTVRDSDPHSNQEETTVSEVEVEQPDHPHDLAALGKHLINADSLDPQEVYNGLCDKESADIQVEGYNRLPQIEVSLTSLKSAYEQCDKARARSYIHKLCKLKIDDDQKVDPDSPDYCFSADKSYLDFFMIIGNRPGIDMFLPKVTPALFSIKLNLKQPIKEFRAKYGMLGFNSSGAMLYIESQPSEDLWIAMAPNEFFEGQGHFEMNEAHGDTRLSDRHYRILISFLIFILLKLRNHNFIIMN
jgi:hypothetical protein